MRNCDSGFVGELVGKKQKLVGCLARYHVTDVKLSYCISIFDFSIQGTFSASSNNFSTENLSSPFVNCPRSCLRGDSSD